MANVWIALGLLFLVLGGLGAAALLLQLLEPLLNWIAGDQGDSQD